MVKQRYLLAKAGLTTGRVRMCLYVTALPCFSKTPCLFIRWDWISFLWSFNPLTWELVQALKCRLNANSHLSSRSWKSISLPDSLDVPQHRDLLVGCCWPGQSVSRALKGAVLVETAWILRSPGEGIHAALLGVLSGVWKLWYHISTTLCSTQ